MVDLLVGEAWAHVPCRLARVAHRLKHAAYGVILQAVQVIILHPRQASCVSSAGGANEEVVRIAKGVCKRHSSMPRQRMPLRIHALKSAEPRDKKEAALQHAQQRVMDDWRVCAGSFSRHVLHACASLQLGPDVAVPVAPPLVASVPRQHQSQRRLGGANKRHVAKYVAVLAVVLPAGICLLVKDARPHGTTKPGHALGCTFFPPWLLRGLAQPRAQLRQGLHAAPDPSHVGVAWALVARICRTVHGHRVSKANGTIHPLGGGGVHALGFQRVHGRRQRLVGRLPLRVQSTKSVGFHGARSCARGFTLVHKRRGSLAKRRDRSRQTRRSFAKLRPVRPMRPSAALRQKRKVRECGEDELFCNLWPYIK